MSFTLSRPRLGPVRACRSLVTSTTPTRAVYGTVLRRRAAPRKQTCAARWPCPRDSCTTSWTGTSNW